MNMALLILLIFALVCFTLNAAGVPTKVNLDAAGKAFLTAALIVSQGLL
jgi:hypothetical protein